MRIWKVAVLGLGLSLSGLSFAVDFSRADALFAKRGEGTDETAKFAASATAFKAYEDIYSSNVSDADKKYAFTQMGRIDIFRGGMLESISKKDRKKVLKNCISYAGDALKTMPGQEPHYIYTACLGSLGKISNLLERVPLAFKLKSEAPAALKATEVNGKYVGGFDGGGILRVLAGVYSNIKAKAVGLYKPEDAVRYAQLALNTASNKYPPFPAPMAGTDYYENYYYQTTAMIAVGMTADSYTSVESAYGVLTTTIQTLNDLAEAGELPKGREPETLYYKHLMEVIKKNIEDCKGSDWNSCLERNLGKEGDDADADEFEEFDENNHDEL